MYNYVPKLVRVNTCKRYLVEDPKRSALFRLDSTNLKNIEITSQWPPIQSVAKCT